MFRFGIRALKRDKDVALRDALTIRGRLRRYGARSAVRVAYGGEVTTFDEMFAFAKNGNRKWQKKKHYAGVHPCRRNPVLPRRLSRGCHNVGCA